MTMNKTTQDNEQAPESAPEPVPEPAAQYSVSGGFVGLLNTLNISLAVTSYQSGRLYLLGRNPKGGLMVNEQYFQKAMGLHYDGSTLYMATLANIYRMKNALRACLLYTSPSPRDRG